MNTEQEAFLQQHANGEMTAQQAAQLLELGEGDTGLPEIGGEPSATPANDQTPGDAAASDEPELTPDNAVILARDGKHTIDYQKLVDEREAAKTAREGEERERQRAEAALQELAELRAQSQQRADAGIAPTKTDNQVAAAEAAIEAGVDPELFGDFSEEAIAKGVLHLVRQQTAALQQQFDEKLANALSPFQQEKVRTVEDAHFGAIYAAHPDLDSITESKELADWLKAQPAYVRAGFDHLSTKGTAAEVIEFFDTFKQATGKTQAAPSVDPKAAAKAVIAQSRPAAPASLSDIPGGTAGPASRDEALAQMGSVEMAEAMASMTPEQIEAYLNRQL